jgi:very-short-patch-repair endonuclease
MKCIICNNELKGEQVRCCSINCREIYKIKNNIKPSTNFLLWRKNKKGNVGNQNNVNVIKKISNTKKEMYKSGEIKNWNDGLTKETDKRVREGGKKGGLKRKGKSYYTDERRIKQSVKQKEWAKNNKEHYRRMRKLCSQISISKPQMELYLLIKERYPEAELEYLIKTNYSWRYADIAIPSLKIDIEYDGQNWHKNKSLDDLRDKQLAEVGWKTIRFDKDNVCLYLNKLQEVTTG